MDLTALLKTSIYLISASLLYPVLVILLLMTLWVVLFGGSFAAEWLERRRLREFPPEKLPEYVANGAFDGTFPHRVTAYVVKLKQVLADQGQHAEVAVENLLAETTLAIWRRMDRLRIFVRLAPGLGLIGTLIPMGTGLAALGQGDMAKLSSDLVIAFTTTVVGLAVGMVSFFFYTVKRRWVEQDIKNIELATEVLTAMPQDGDSLP